MDELNAGLFDALADALTPHLGDEAVGTAKKALIALGEAATLGGQHVANRFSTVEQKALRAIAEDVRANA